VLRRLAPLRADKTSVPPPTINKTPTAPPTGRVGRGVGASPRCPIPPTGRRQRLAVGAKTSLRLEPDPRRRHLLSAGHVAIVALTVREPVTRSSSTGPDRHAARRADHHRGQTRRRPTGGVAALRRSLDDGRRASFTLPVRRAAAVRQATLHLDSPAPSRTSCGCFYRSKYSRDGAAANTWLEPQPVRGTDARLSSPAGTEPPFKAVFDPTLVVDPALTVPSTLSSPRRRPPTAESRSAAPTHPHSPTSSPRRRRAGGHRARQWSATRPLRVCACRRSARLAASARPSLLLSGPLRDLLRSKYPPGDKLYLVAVPDFAAGPANGEPRLQSITFRETALLVYETASTQQPSASASPTWWPTRKTPTCGFRRLVRWPWWTALWLQLRPFAPSCRFSPWTPEAGVAALADLRRSRASPWLLTGCAAQGRRCTPSRRAQGRRGHVRTPNLRERRPRCCACGAVTAQPEVFSGRRARLPRQAPRQHRDPPTLGGPWRLRPRRSPR